MKALLILLCICLPLAGYAIDVQQPFDDTDKQQRYEALTSEIRCLVCQNETIADSTAPLAADLRREVRRMVESGQSDAEIKDFLVERYGDFVLYRPQFKSKTAALWLAPLFLLVIGVLAFARILRRRAMMPNDIDEPLMSVDKEVDERSDT